MGLCSLALYSCLTSDLSRVLPTVPFRRLSEGNLRDAIWPGIAKREVASLFLLDSILKKFEDSKSSEADDVALTKFLACNSHCESFRSIDTSQLTEIQAIALGEMKKSFSDFFFNPGGDYWLNPEIISEGMAFGPGASVGASGDSFYQKVAAGPLTGTVPSLYTLYKREASKCSLWDETEKIRFDHFGGYKEVQGSRLSFVPKTHEISRTICTEPVLNMFVQKGIGNAFEARLMQRFGINLSTQPDKNRELARIGSLNGTFGTIDLSSASDTISLNLLREILPSYVLSWLMESRSGFVTLPNGQLQQMHMVSSMGNAFTFPLQTILFSSVVIGVYNALNIAIVKPHGSDPELPNYNLGNYAVFGDDIIIRREAYDLVVNLLERMGFFVNHDKSFNEGPFRESCGLDFWDGYNVRGVYCRSLKTKQDVYSLINRLNVWSSNHAVPLPCTIQYLLGSSGLKFNPVPPWESDVAGIKVPLWIASSQPAGTRRDKWTGSVVYMRYLPRDESTSLLDVGSRPQVFLRGRTLFHNPAGILYSAIRGYLRDGKLAIRTRLTKYLKRLAIAPCWDYRDPCRSLLTNDGWHNWKSCYVDVNLGSCSHS